MSHTPKSTLVPSSMLGGEEPRCFLSAVFPIGDGEDIGVMDFPAYGASLVYVREGDGVPVLASLIAALPACDGYNKILAAYCGATLHLAIAQGAELKLAVSYPAQDFTTAEYYVFLAVKTLQINPEVSSIRFITPLSEEQEMSLGRYFHGVEAVQA